MGKRKFFSLRVDRDNFHIYIRLLARDYDHLLAVYHHPSIFYANFIYNLVPHSDNVFSSMNGDRPIIESYVQFDSWKFNKIFSK